MKILLTTDYYWPHIGGGVEVVVQQLSERLVSRGHNVTVLTLNTRNAPSEEQHNGVWIHRISSVEVSRLLGLQLALPLNPYQVRTFLRSCRYDILHVHGRFYTTSLLAMLFRTESPSMLTVHLGPVRMGKGIAAYERILGNRLLSSADVVTAVGPHAAKVRTGSKIIYNGVDVELFRPLFESKKDFTVLVVGRLIRNKGPHLMLEAIPQLHENVKTVFVGDGPLRRSLEARAEELKIGDRVSFLGERRDVSELLPTASLLVRPSVTEGMSLSVLEALACGVPVIASPAAAEGLIEHGTNGIRLTDMSPKEIALHINDLYFDAKRLNSMSIYARKTAENYSWEKSVDEYEFQYRKLLQSRKVSAVNEVVNDPTNQI